MSTSVAVETNALGLPSEDIGRYLQQADYLAEKEEWSADNVDAARRLFVDLVLVIRALTMVYRLQASSECPICASRCDSARW